MRRWHEAEVMLIVYLGFMYLVFKSDHIYKKPQKPFDNIELTFIYPLKNVSLSPHELHHNEFISEDYIKQCIEADVNEIRMEIKKMSTKPVIAIEARFNSTG